MTLKEAISDFFTVRSWKSKLRGDTLAGKRPEGGSGTKGFEGVTIRLLESSRPPATPVERLAVETLKREGPTSFKRLVERIAREVYFDEVRNGAWILDIGLFGPDLFVPEVNFELKAADGVLWKIERSREESHGILSNLP